MIKSKYPTICSWKKHKFNLRDNFITKLLCKSLYFHLMAGVAAPLLRSESGDGVLRGHCDLRGHCHLHVLP